MKLVIMRGVSGSGKSTKAQEIIKAFGGKSVCCSADHYFINKQGKYVFNPKKLGAAHGQCKARAKEAMGRGVPLVVLDNTNTQRWEFQPYIDMADEYGYEVEIIRVGDFDPASLELYAKRNSHGVPLEAIKRMASRWEE